MEKMNDYQREQRALQDAFVHRMLLDYDIREVTTQRQAKNGTREFEFPVSTFDGKYNWYKKWQVKTNRKRATKYKTTTRYIQKWICEKTKWLLLSLPY
tara:strand:+ start:126 stop:419 length:294 start_codon:yes stop_codon:yes gene_type:complete